MLVSMSAAFASNEARRAPYQRSGKPADVSRPFGNCDQRFDHRSCPLPLLHLIQYSKERGTDQDPIARIIKNLADIVRNSRQPSEQPIQKPFNYVSRLRLIYVRAAA